MTDGRQLVSMERFEGLTTEVDCDKTMSLKFVSEDAFKYAIGAWNWVNEKEENNFVMIANHDGCGPDQERVPYSITDVDYDEENFIAYLTGTEMKWTDMESDLIIEYGTVPDGALTRRLDVSKSGSVTMSMQKSLGASKNLWSGKHSGITLNLNCLQCGTSGSLRFSGRVKASIGLFKITIKELYMQTQPQNLQARLHLQMTASGSGSYSNSKRLLSFPLPGSISIPKIFKLGATCDYDVGMDASIKGSASLSYGVIAKVPNSAMLKVDLRTPSKSKFSGWKPTFEQIPLKAKAEINGRLAVYSQPGVSCGIKVLNKYGYEVALKMKLPEIAAVLSSKVNSHGGLCGNPAYKKSLNFALTVGVGMTFHAGSYKKSLWEKSTPLYSKCIGQ